MFKFIVSLKKKILTPIHPNLPPPFCMIFFIKINLYFLKSYEIKYENVKFKKIINKKNPRIKSIGFKKHDLNDKLNLSSLKKLNWLIR